jgi:hypothetical protein
VRRGANPLRETVLESVTTPTHFGTESQWLLRQAGTRRCCWRQRLLGSAPTTLALRNAILEAMATSSSATSTQALRDARRYGPPVSTALAEDPPVLQAVGAEYAAPSTTTPDGGKAA